MHQLTIALFAFLGLLLNFGYSPFVDGGKISLLRLMVKDAKGMKMEIVLENTQTVGHLKSQLVMTPFTMLIYHGDILHSTDDNTTLEELGIRELNDLGISAGDNDGIGGAQTEHRMMDSFDAQFTLVYSRAMAIDYLLQKEILFEYEARLLTNMDKFRSMFTENVDFYELDEILHAVIISGLDLNALLSIFRDENGIAVVCKQPLLNVAVEFNLNIVCFLVNEYGLNVNAQNGYDGKSPLILCPSTESGVEIVEFLVRKGVKKQSIVEFIQIILDNILTRSTFEEKLAENLEQIKLAYKMLESLKSSIL